MDQGRRDVRLARILFGGAAAFNMAVGLPLLFARPMLTRTLNVDPATGTNAVTANLVGCFVLLFGLIYAMIARDPVANRNLVRPMIIGKSLAVAGTLQPWFMGEIDGTLPLLVLTDMLFAVAFALYLGFTRRRGPR